MSRWGNVSKGDENDRKQIETLEIKNTTEMKNAFEILSPDSLKTMNH